MSRVRTLIAEDHPQMRDALADLLSTDPGIEIVGVADDPERAIGLADERQPQVALVDARMAGRDGPCAVREIAALAPAPRVIAISASEQSELVIETLRAGAIGYLVTGGPPGETLESIHRANRGQGSLSSPVVATVIDRATDRPQGVRTDAEERAAIASEIRAVIDEGSIAIVFQPIFDLKRDRVVGVEALARFPERADLRPVDWFTEAHALGLGAELELAGVVTALDEVARAGREIDAANGPTVFVNVSPRVASSEPLRTLLHRRDTERRVVIEVTEHAGVEDYPRFKRATERLRAEGACFAVDNFGAGQASLRHVLELGPDIIKLDFSLTRGIDGDRARRAMASSLISFAGETEATVIAGGIETEGERAALRELGVKLGQGFLLGRPEPLGARRYPTAAVADRTIY